MYYPGQNVIIKIKFLNKAVRYHGKIINKIDVRDICKSGTFYRVVFSLDSGRYILPVNEKNISGR